MEITAYTLAQRFVGLAEVAGAVDNAQIDAFLRLDQPESGLKDETPWCSAFVNWISWLLRLPRSKSLAARSSLSIGIPVNLDDAEAGFDIVILWRDSPTAATGHVGFYAGREGENVLVLGGNQNNRVSIQSFSADRVLGVRRLASQ
jgi:uncharacterized protein (TIGR02594 family)